SRAGRSARAGPTSVFRGSRVGTGSPVRGCNLGLVAERPDHRTNWRSVRFPSFLDLGRFAVFSGLTFFAAWVAGTGRVPYTLIMLVIAAALAFAVVDLVDYEIVKRRRRG